MHFNLANSQSLAAVIMPFKSSTPTQMMWPVGQKGKISVGFRQLDSSSSKHFVAQPCVCYVRSQKLRNNIFFFLLDSFNLMQRFCIHINVSQENRVLCHVFRQFSVVLFYNTVHLKQNIWICPETWNDSIFLHSILLLICQRVVSRFWSVHFNSKLILKIFSYIINKSKLRCFNSSV